MKLTDMIPLNDEIEAARRTNPNFRELWEQSAFAEEVATRVIRYRADHGLTQAKFGRLTGLTQSAVARLESGDETPTLKTLARISATTGLTFHLAVTQGAIEVAA